MAVDEGGEGYRLGKVLKVLDQGHLKIKLETLKLDLSLFEEVWEAVG